jgi:hypothetical protein
MDEGNEVRQAQQENAAEEQESDEELDASDESDEDLNEGLVASEEALMREKVVRDAIAQLQAGQTLLRLVALAALRRRRCSSTSISNPLSLLQS